MIRLCQLRHGFDLQCIHWSSPIDHLRCVLMRGRNSGDVHRYLEAVARYAAKELMNITLPPRLTFSSFRKGNSGLDAYLVFDPSCPSQTYSLYYAHIHKQPAPLHMYHVLVQPIQRCNSCVYARFRAVRIVHSPHIQTPHLNTFHAKADIRELTIRCPGGNGIGCGGHGTTELRFASMYGFRNVQTLVNWLQTGEFFACCI